MIAQSSSPAMLMYCLHQSDLPEQFPKLREDLLKLADKFASLPEETREKYSRKEVQYM